MPNTTETAPAPPEETHDQQDFLNEAYSLGMEHGHDFAALMHRFVKWGEEPLYRIPVEEVPIAPPA